MKEYEAAYVSGDDVILEYTTEADANDHRWAKINFSKLNKNHMHESGTQYEIHKKPLPSSKKESLQSVPLIDIREKIGPFTKSHEQYDRIHAYIYGEPEKPFQVYIYPASKYHLSIPFKDAFNGEDRVYHKEPRDLFVPATHYPSVMIRYPLAIVKDVLTYPLFLIAPRWP